MRQRAAEKFELCFHVRARIAKHEMQAQSGALAESEITILPERNEATCFLAGNPHPRVLRGFVAVNQRCSRQPLSDMRAR